MNKNLLIAICAVSLAYLAFSCVPNPQSHLKALQALYKNVACIQCEAFNITDQTNCPHNNTISGTTCGLLITSFLHTAKHCVVASLSCVPEEYGKVAYWGLSTNKSSAISIISETNNTVSAPLTLTCNDKLQWEISFSPLFVPKKPSMYQSGEFTLHCISSEKFNQALEENEIKNENEIASAKDALTLEAEGSGEETEITTNVTITKLPVIADEIGADELATYNNTTKDIIVL